MTLPRRAVLIAMGAYLLALGCAVYRWYGLDIERPDLPGVAAWYERLRSRRPFAEHVMLPLT